MLSREDDATGYQKPTYNGPAGSGGERFQGEREVTMR